MSATAISKEVLDAHGLIKDVNAHHAEVLKSGADALSNATQAGAMLTGMKKKVPHGEWGSLLKRLDFNERTAQWYMKLSKNLPAAIAKGKQVGSDLTIRGAMKLISESKPKKAQKRSSATDLTDKAGSKGVTENGSSGRPKSTTTANSAPVSTQPVTAKEDSVVDEKTVRTDGKISGGATFDVAEIEAATPPKPPKNGSVVKPEFDDAKCKAAYVALVKMLDDRWSILGGSIGHRKNATNHLSLSFDAYGKWAKGDK